MKEVQTLCDQDPPDEARNSQNKMRASIRLHHTRSDNAFKSRKTVTSTSLI